MTLHCYIALILNIQALGSYLRPTYEYELHTLPNTKVGTAKDHGENYMKVRPPLVRHLLPNRLLQTIFLLRGVHTGVHTFETHNCGTTYS